MGDVEDFEPRRPRAHDGTHIHVGDQVCAGPPVNQYGMVVRLRADGKIVMETEGGPTIIVASKSVLVVTPVGATNGE